MPHPPAPQPPKSPPPPPAKRELISRALLTGLAALTLAAAPAAQAQTAGTVTIGVAENLGLTPMTSLRVNEGDVFAIVITAHGKTGGALLVNNTVSGTAHSGRF